MSAAQAAGTAVTFVWLGMVLAISFLEAPLKFRAPGVDLRTGLAIGRVVFRALNRIELVLAAGLVAAAALAIQLVAVRPRLTRRSDRVLAGQDAPRSASHHGYLAMEMVKVAALVTTGAALLTAAHT